ncbi:helix-turn-helix domain-containing protein [Xanthomonas campestris]|uniref:helix-turn-helix transcriptional regulator n=1 Tax=Xanthomonas cannabis TaxID=1885674 RepID=UPI001E49F254|nr:helix-turn-helix domain-containing protein [Xanthomonas campestris pv. zinniae]
MTNPNERLSYNVDEALAATGLNRSAFYRALQSGQIQSFKFGKRRMVSARALQQFIEAQEAEATRRSVA